MMKFLTYIYNSGYCAGHESTVEGGFLPLAWEDMSSYHKEEVQEIVEEMKNEDKYDGSN